MNPSTAPAPVHFYAPTGVASRGIESLLALVSLHAGRQPLVSCRPLGLWFADDLATVELRLAGPSGARVERLHTTVAYATLRWGRLAPGTWTATANGFNVSGGLQWHAPHVRFRVQTGDLSQVNLHFQKVAP